MSLRLLSFQMRTIGRRLVINDRFKHVNVLRRMLCVAHDSAIKGRVLSTVWSVMSKGGKINNLQNDSHLMRALGMDNSQHNEIIDSLEEEFQIEITDNDAQSLMTLNDIVQYVIEKREIRNYFVDNNFNTFANDF